MIKLNELRFGNIVLEQDGNEEPYKEAIIQHISRNLAIEFLKPIPLTEEWLLKFGFIQDDNYCNHWATWFDKGNFSIEFDTCFLVFYNDTEMIIIKSVHQLQNLYFALTGEELTIKN